MSAFGSAAPASDGAALASSSEPAATREVMKVRWWAMEPRYPRPRSRPRGRRRAPGGTVSDMTAHAAPDLTAEAIERAAERLEPVVKRTPLEPSERLSSPLGVPVLLKREDMQVARSYKVRGAYNLIAGLSAEERARGVVCASAGNHGQGLAFACRELKIRGRVFLPTNTPRQKRQRIADIGGEWIEPVIAGRSYDEASAAAHADAATTGAIYVHPFDDARTIAGQGTVGRELAEQAAAQGCAIDTVVVPVGGGGLIGGIALWLKRHHPGVRVVGAEPAGAASMSAALSSRRAGLARARRHVRRRRRRRPRRRADLPARARPRRRGRRGAGGRHLHRDARPLPVGRHHRRAGRGARQRRRAQLV